MPRYSADTIQAIKDRVSLLDVVRAAVPKVQKKGQNWWACCPFHQEKTPSFSVKENEGFYHCFGCGAHGDVFTFVEETQGGGFNEAVEYLANLAGVTLKAEQADPVAEARRNDGFDALSSAATFYQQQLPGSPAVDYLKNRGITGAVAKEFSLGWVADDWRNLADHLQQQGFKPEVVREAGLTLKSDKGRDDYDRFRGRLMFPIHDLKDRVVGFGGRVLGDGEPKYLNSSETPFFHKSRILFNLNRARTYIKQANEALLVEGYMDVIGLWQQGVKTAVAACGTAVTAEQVQLLWRHHSSPIVCLDGDNAGRLAAERLAERVLPVLAPGKSLRFVFLPEGEDPDSYVRANGAATFANQLKQAQDLETVLWQSISRSANLQQGADRAAVEEQIKDLSKQVTHDTLRKHITGALKDRMWTVIKASRGRSQGKVAQTVIPAADQGAVARLILGALCAKPEWLGRYSEELAPLEFTDTTHQALWRAFFRALIEKRLEKEELDSYFKTCGLADEVADLAQDQRLQSLLARADAEEVWRQLCAERLHRQQAQAAKQAQLKQLAVALGASDAGN